MSKNAWNVLVIALLGCLTLGCFGCSNSSRVTGQNASSSSALSSASSSSSVSVSSSAQVSVSPYIHWSDGQFLDSSNKPLLMQGVCLGNQVWSSAVAPVGDLTEADFVRIQSMHMNAVRFYLSYKFFENDAAPLQWKANGFAWLDTNIAWAKRHGIYLILNMHVPEGGYQSNGAGAALWDDASNQQRLKALWATLAAHYANETTIAGLDLVNEPVVSQSKRQWQTLAQSLIDTIRTADTNHLIFVERLNGIIHGSYDNDASMNFVTVSDPIHKTGLTFHFYSPIEYTHQLTSWTSFGEDGPYPDSSRLELGQTEWATATFNSPKIAAGTTDWTFYQGSTYLINADTISLAKPTLVCQSVGTGTVWFDSLRVEELDSTGSVISTLENVDIADGSNWWFWAANTVGSGAFDSTQGLGTPGSIMITGTTGDANEGNNNFTVVVHKGHRYRASGYMKGLNVPITASCLVRLDLEKAVTPIQVRDKNYLASVLDQYYSYAKAQNVPVYVGEFGLNYVNFLNNKGRINWVTDMIDLLQARGIAFTLHDYRENNFGIYYGTGPTDPSNANQPLINLLTQKL